MWGKWYEHCDNPINDLFEAIRKYVQEFEHEGIVEYLGGLVRDGSNLENTKYIGALILVIVAILLAHNGARIFKEGRPKKDK